MKHSRVVKFKSYRDSFTKAGAPNIDGADNIISGLSKENDLSSTTNTLPINEVIHEVNIKDEQIKLERRIKRDNTLKICIICAIVGALIGLTIYFGILAFGGK